jgi:CBS domain-containing protein
VPTVRDLLARKRPEAAELVTLPPSASALEAAQLMNARTIGAVLVIGPDERAGQVLLGIFTERDILRRVVAAQLHPREVPLAEVMTQTLVTCDPETSLEEVAQVMTTRRIRHLPVLDRQGAPIGMISIGDVLAARVREQEGEIEALNRYIHDLR